MPGSAGFGNVNGYSVGRETFNDPKLLGNMKYSTHPWRGTAGTSTSKTHNPFSQNIYLGETAVQERSNQTEYSFCVIKFGSGEDSIIQTTCVFSSSGKFYQAAWGWGEAGECWRVRRDRRK